MKRSGSDSIIYLDESGFNSGVYRPHGWGAKGQRVYGDCSGKALISYKLAVSSMWLEAFSATLVFRDLYNGAIQPVVGKVPDSGIEARADGGSG